MLSLFKKTDAGSSRTWLPKFLQITLVLSVVSLFALVPGCPSAGDDDNDNGDGC